jgi:restriction endonuclease S subunit
VSKAQIPRDGWGARRFSDVAESVTERVDDPASAGVQAYVGLDHLDTDTIKISRWGLPTDVEATKLKFFPGDVIYARRRAYQRKLGVAEFEGICSAHALVLRANPEVCLPGFLPYFLQSDQFHERALDISVGSLSPTINWKTLAMQEFLVPPLEAQRQIVEVLDAIGALEECLSAVVSSIRHLMAAVAHEVAELSAATGALTPVGRLVEDDRPVTYGILKPGTGHPGGVPVIKVRDFPNGLVETDNLLLTSPEIDEEYKRSRLRAGDLLISIRGTVGRLAEVPSELAGANITQDTARLTIRGEHDAKFIRWMLASNFVQRQIQSRITGLAVQGINLGSLRLVTVPTPPPEDQRALTVRFASLDSLLQLSQSQLQATRDITRLLRHHLLGGEANHVQ